MGKERFCNWLFGQITYHVETKCCRLLDSHGSKYNCYVFMVVAVLIGAKLCISECFADFDILL